MNSTGCIVLYFYCVVVVGFFIQKDARNNTKKQILVNSRPTKPGSPTVVHQTCREVNGVL